MKRIYMAGAGGMLGHAFHEVFGQSYELRCTDKDVNESWLELLDFRNLEAYRKDVSGFKPDYLFHIGAHTDLEYCENNVEDAYLTNTTAAENAVWIANELDIPLLYISTAGIYDGSQDTFDDWDKPNPMGHYARSKYAGEVYVQQNVRRHLICRAGWMMGGGPEKDKKFINKIFQQIKGGADELFVVDDKLGTPTYTVSFAQGIFKVVESGLYGLYNQVCGGDCSRYDVAVEFVKELGLEDKIKVTKVSSDHFKTEYFAPRPPSEKLVNFKLDARGINFMPEWHEALKDYAKRFQL